jgi:hypothetical protein
MDLFIYESKDIAKLYLSLVWNPLLYYIFILLILILTKHNIVITSCSMMESSYGLT